MLIPVGAPIFILLSIYMATLFGIAHIGQGLATGGQLHLSRLTVLNWMGRVAALGLAADLVVIVMRNEPTIIVLLLHWVIVVTVVVLMLTVVWLLFVALQAARQLSAMNEPPPIQGT